MKKTTITALVILGLGTAAFAYGPGGGHCKKGSFGAEHRGGIHKLVKQLDNLIKKVNEYYQDNSFKLKLPNNVDPMETLNIEMQFKCNNDVGEDYKLTQKLVFNEQSRSLRPDKLLLGKF